MKPDNILLERGTGRAMVADFGIAALAESATTEGSHEVMGTAEFMSPEQATGAEVDARSDLYSLGCVAFYALSGRVPFTAETPAAILARHVTEAPPSMASLALESIRLGLLLMHGGGGTVESLTMDVEAAREVAAEMANLLEGHREVERLLRERRRTGVIGLGGPATSEPLGPDRS